MDDNLAFKAINRIWIFVVPALCLTALTITVTVLWGRLAALINPFTSQDIIRDEEGEEATISEAQAALEPRTKSEPNLIDLINGLMDNDGNYGGQKDEEAKEDGRG